jgi:hypothetical protein
VCTGFIIHKGTSSNDPERTSSPLTDPFGRHRGLVGPLRGLVMVHHMGCGNNIIVLWLTL